MTILGITGGIGSGKSTVSQILSLCNIPVYIADMESKRLTDTSPVIKKDLINLLGEELYKDGVLDKKLLASHIFNDKSTLEKVNKIIHPEVRKDFFDWIKRNKKYDIVAVESAIMFESGFHEFVDKKVLIYAPLELRIERTVKRDKTTREQVLSRIKNQKPDEEKIELSDFIIVCDEKHSVIEQTLNIIRKIRQDV